MNECDFLGIYSAWSSLKFLDVWLDVSHQFMKTIYHCLFEYFLCLVLSSPFVTKITHMFKYLILSNDKSWILCFIFFTLPPLFCFRLNHFCLAVLSSQTVSSSMSSLLIYQMNSPVLTSIFHLQHFLFFQVHRNGFLYLRAICILFTVIFSQLVFKNKLEF